MTARVSVSSSGEEANSSSYRPAISAGRFVAFWSFASSLVPATQCSARRVPARPLDRNHHPVSVASDGTGATTKAVGTTPSRRWTVRGLSVPGPNLVPNDVNWFRRFLRDTRTDQYLPVDPAGTPESLTPAPDGQRIRALRRVLLLSENLVAGDANMHQDACAISLQG